MRLSVGAWVCAVCNASRCWECSCGFPALPALTRFLAQPRQKQGRILHGNLQEVPEYVMSEEEMSAACGVMLFDAPFFHDDKVGCIERTAGRKLMMLIILNFFLGFSRCKMRL